MPDVVTVTLIVTVLPAGIVVSIGLHVNVLPERENVKPFEVRFLIVLFA